MKMIMKVMMTIGEGDGDDGDKDIDNYDVVMIIIAIITIIMIMIVKTIMALARKCSNHNNCTLFEIVSLLLC